MERVVLRDSRREGVKGPKARLTLRLDPKAPHHPKAKLTLSPFLS